MADLQRYVYYACGVINYDIKSVNDVAVLMAHMVEVCENYNRITKYYYIAHTETDVIHIHFIYYLSSQTQLMTIFNKIRRIVVDKYHDTRNDEGINIMKCDNFNNHMRYLLHQDEKSKKEGKRRYEIEDIVSNDDIDIIDSITKSVKGEIDAYYLRDCVLDTQTEFELMNKLGLKVYHKYRYEISILKDNRAMLMLEREKERNEKAQQKFLDSIDDNDIPF